MIFTGARLDAGLYNDLLYRPDEPLLPFPLKAQVDEAIRGADRRAGPAVADREAAGAEALGAGAGARSARS